METAIETTSLSDFKFSDFVKEIRPNLQSAMYESDWAIKLNEIENYTLDKSSYNVLTFADDRLVLIAYKILCKVESSASDMNKAIVERFDEVYGESNDVPLFMQEKQDSRFYKTHEDMKNNGEATMTDEEIEQNLLELKAIAEIILADKHQLSKKEFYAWRELLDNCNLMLG